MVLVPMFSLSFFVFANTSKISPFPKLCFQHSITFDEILLQLPCLFFRHLSEVHSHLYMLSAKYYASIALLFFYFLIHFNTSQFSAIFFFSLTCLSNYFNFQNLFCQAPTQARQIGYSMILSDLLAFTVRFRFSKPSCLIMSHRNVNYLSLIFRTRLFFFLLYTRLPHCSHISSMVIPKLSFKTTSLLSSERKCWTLISIRLSIHYFLRLVTPLQVI